MIICTEGLTKKYGEFTAVEDLDLHVYAGEIYGFLGPNGAGKTTTIMMLLGIEKPSAGKIFLFDEEVTPTRQINLHRRIGMMSETQYLYEDMTAIEYLDFFADVNQVKNKRKRILELLELVDLIPSQNVKIGTLSRGMQQKLGLIRAMLHNPDLLILDEPVSGLDPYGILQVRELITRAKNEGKAIFLSSHILSEVEKTADRIGIIQKGKLLTEGLLENIKMVPGAQTDLEIELVDAKEIIMSALMNSPLVKHLDKKGNLLKLAIEEKKGNLAKISELITVNGGIITDMRTKKVNLEEAFMTITDSNVKSLLHRE